MNIDFKKAAALLLAGCTCLSVYGCAGREADEQTASAQPTEAATEVTEPVTELTEAPEQTSSPETESPVTTAAITTSVPETTAAPEGSLYDGNAHVLDVAWHFGYVGSSTNSSYPNMLNTSGSYYSYSDVITIEKAGTRITFRDDNTNSGGDSNYASAAAYVISSWFQTGGKWKFNSDGFCYPGSGSGTSDIAAKDGSAIVYTYITSKDNECIRLCYRSGEKSNFKPAKYPDVTLKYTGEAGTSAGVAASNEEYEKYIQSLKAEASYGCLNGITMYCIGDSYFAGNGLDKKFVWPCLLARKYGMTFINYGINGSAVSSFDTAVNPMCTRVSAMSSTAPDLVIFEGGKNDYNVSAPVGEVTDTSEKTFCGAVNSVLDQLQKKYPDAVIVCITPWNVAASPNDRGMVVKDYTKAFLAVCSARGIACFDASDTTVCPVDMTSVSFRTRYCMSSTDISHLNFEGHKLVLTAFEKFVAEAYAAAGKGA